MKRSSLSLLCLILGMIACRPSAEVYVCKPCDLPCDTLTFHKPGTCPHCGMELVKKSEVIDPAQLGVNDVKLSTGSGVFLIEGGPTRTEKTINIFYYQPQTFTPTSQILMVIPGAGRNGDSYRDAWIEAAEKYSVLVISPQFPEDTYPFDAYHLGGLISVSNLFQAVSFVENSNHAVLDEEKFTYQVNAKGKGWLFADLDRIFELVKEATGSTQTHYDVFGHSAGGQILHRMVLFYPQTKADRIVAANAGFYTLPDTTTPLPFGIKDATISANDLPASFQKNLVVFLGEADNATEQGGTLLRSPTVDRQGLYRFSRGQYFYTYAQRLAAEWEVPFNWQVEVVPKVGHNHRKMGAAAAKLLYETP